MNVVVTDVKFISLTYYIFRKLLSKKIFESSLRTISKGIKCNNVIIAPVRIRSNHWILILVVQNIQTAVVFDSLITGMSEDVANVIDALLTYIHLAKRTKIDWRQWTVFCPTDIPKQSATDGNCGVHVLAWEHAILQSCDCLIRRENMTAVRMPLANLITTQPELKKSLRNSLKNRGKEDNEKKAQLEMMYNL